MLTSIQSPYISNSIGINNLLVRKSFSTHPEVSQPIDNVKIKLSAEQRVTPTEAESSINKEQLNEKMKTLTSLLFKKELDLQFSTDETTGKDIVKFIDSKNKEVVHQIPSEQMLKVIESIDNFLNNYSQKAPIGVMVNERA